MRIALRVLTSYSSIRGERGMCSFNVRYSTTQTLAFYWYFTAFIYRKFSTDSHVYCFSFSLPNSVRCRFFIFRWLSSYLPRFLSCTSSSTRSSSFGSTLNLLITLVHSAICSMPLLTIVSITVCIVQSEGVRKKPEGSSIRKTSKKRLLHCNHSQRITVS